MLGLEIGITGVQSVENAIRKGIWTYRNTKYLTVGSPFLPQQTQNIDCCLSNSSSVLSGSEGLRQIVIYCLFRVALSQIR